MNHVATCAATNMCTEPSGQLASVGYPSHYYQRSTCTWLIQTARGTFLHLWFLTFDIPSLGECESSSLTLYSALIDDDGAVAIGTYCNSKLPPSLTRSDFNFLYMKFHSGAEEPGNGFLVEYKELRLGKEDVLSLSPGRLKTFVRFKNKIISIHIWLNWQLANITIDWDKSLYDRSNVIQYSLEIFRSLSLVHLYWQWSLLGKLFTACRMTSSLVAVRAGQKYCRPLIIIR